MENYDDAYLARRADVETLNQGQRKVGAANMGGYAIECLLKSILVPYSMRSSGKCKPSHMKTHDLIELITQINPIFDKIEPDSPVTEWIDTVFRPDRTKTFIGLRYQGETVMDAEYDNWYQAYTSLRDWLLEERDWLLQEWQSHGT